MGAWTLALLLAGFAGVGAATTTVTDGSRWSGLWEGDHWVGGGSIRIVMFLGKKSWIDLGGQCSGELTPKTLGEWDAEFAFKPVSGKCETPGTLTAKLRQDRKGNWNYQGQKILRIKLNTPTLTSNAMLFTPYESIEEEEFRFLVEQGNGRFVWPGAEKPPASARAEAKSIGYWCITSQSYTLSGERPQTMTFESSGAGAGYLFLLGCDGDCDRAIFEIATNNPGYVQYYNDHFGTPAAYFESRSWAHRTRTASWRFLPDHETGQVGDRRARVHIGIMSREPGEYGPGCRAPF